MGAALETNAATEAELSAALLRLMDPSFAGRPALRAIAAEAALTPGPERADAVIQDTTAAANVRSTSPA